MSVDIEQLINRALSDVRPPPNLATDVVRGYERRRHRRRIVGVVTATSLAIIGAVLWGIVSGTSSGLSTVIPASPASPHGPPSTQRPLTTASDVKLVAAPAILRQQCLSAANRLGFAVPCPSLVPAIGGHGMSCPPPRGAAIAPCVGLEGLPTYSVFALELSGFDVPTDYVGIGGKPERLLVLEARPRSDSPAIPCIGATEVGKVIAGQWGATEYSCPNDSLAAQREARHGEGTYVGHLLLEWTQGGIDYIAGADGHTNVNIQLLKSFVSATTLIAPTGH